MPEDTELTYITSDGPPGGSDSPDDIEVVELDPRLEFGVGIIGDDEDGVDVNDSCENTSCC